MDKPGPVWASDWRRAILEYRLLAARLGKSRQKQASPGKWAGDRQSWNTDYWQLDLASRGKSREVGWQQAILEYRLLAARQG